MQALVSDLAEPYVRFAEVSEPEVRSDHALVVVRAISLNRGEVKRLETLESGTVAGWDLAGIVEQAAADGSGPPAPPRTLAPLPAAVSFEQAATLPVAALTALRALHVAGFVLGRRVLVTGASGGVGRFAIQLARLGGAHVTAIARRTEGLTALLDRRVAGKAVLTLD